MLIDPLPHMLSTAFRVRPTVQTIWGMGYAPTTPLTALRHRFAFSALLRKSQVTFVCCLLLVVCCCFLFAMSAAFALGLYWGSDLSQKHVLKSFFRRRRLVIIRGLNSPSNSMTRIVFLTIENWPPSGSFLLFSPLTHEVVSKSQKKKAVSALSELSIFEAQKN